MPIFEIELGGKIYEAEANDPAAAVAAIKKLHVRDAGQASVDRAMAGAQARSAPTPKEQRPQMFQDIPTNDLSQDDRSAYLKTAGGAMATTLPLLAVPARVAGGMVGGQEAYRRTGGNIPATLAGAAGGAALPGPTMAASGIAAAADYAGGGMAGNITAGGLTSVAAAVLLRKYGGSLGKLLQGRFAPQIMAEGVQAAKAAQGTPQAAALVKGTNPEMLANIEKVFLETGSTPAAAKAIATSEAARGAASAAETVSQSLPGVVSGAKLSQESLKQIMQLQAMAKQGGASKKTVAALAKELFPDNPEVVEMITGPMTTMSTIHVP